MAKYTVADLAKILKVDSKEIMKKLEEDGTFLPNTQSVLSNAEVASIYKKITGKELKMKKAETPANQEAAAPKKTENTAETKETTETAKTETPKEEPKKAEDKGPKLGYQGKIDVKPQTGSKEGQKSTQSGTRDGQKRDGQSQNRDGQKRDGQKRDGQSQGQRRDNQNAQQGSQGGRDASRSDNNRGASAPSGDNGGNNRYSTKKDYAKKKDNNKNNGEDRTRKNTGKNNYAAQPFDDEALAQHKKKKPTKKPATAEERALQKAQEEEIKIVALPDTITVKDFADAMHKPIPQVIKALMSRGIMASMNQTIEFEQAEDVAEEMGILVEHQEEEDIFKALAEASAAADNLVPRAPVVVVMGHVDHGKTSLLDAIRNTRVTAGEAGGITQHIGASVVEINGRQITFLDTPGHEAFTAMRLRGAMATDIAILVVAADDGVMPQTIEAINHAKAAGVQIVVAINKIDRPGANPDKIKQELTEYGLIAEEWGGSTICVPVSAKQHIGIDELLENVILVADVLELKADPTVPAVGTVIESELDKGRGAVATVLVQKGTLHVGDIVVSGATYGRVRAMVDDKGKKVKEAGPSTPVEIIGLNDVPPAGEPMYVTATEKDARDLAERVSAKERSKMIEGNRKVNLNNLFGDIQAGNVKDLNIIVKADVQGSVEAVKQSLEKLSNDEVSVHVIHGAVGGINESDVTLASASNSIIIGFNVRPDNVAKQTAENENVDIRLYRVIYNAIEDIEAAMKGMLDPKFEEKLWGHAEIRQTIKASGIGMIAGCYVTDGKIVRNAQVRLIRDNIVIYEGAIDSLRRFKDDVKEVASGYECGIVLERYQDIKEGDIIEAFTMEEVAR